jgi:hypothetical protein
MTHRRNGFRLVQERKLAELLPSLRSGGVLEASGVVVKNGRYFVVFDNVRRVAQIGSNLKPGSADHVWLGRLRGGEGYEDIAYSATLRRFYALIEAEKHPDGTYKAIVEEFDEQFRYKGRGTVDVPFEKRNRGFEGLAAVRSNGADYLLALCEGNDGRAGGRGRTPGGGRIHVLQKRGRGWQSVSQIRLPSSLDFKDYSALALRGDRLAVVSQKSARMWVGKLRLKSWTIDDDGRTYDFPRNQEGKRLYCTVEGVDWLSPTTFVMVSDLRKKGYPGRCSRTDQSIHIFRLSGSRAVRAS